MGSDFKPHPLRLGFVGYNARLTDNMFNRFARDNQEQVEWFNTERILMKDGTVVFKVLLSNERIFHGMYFDQLILADDERKMIYWHLGKEIQKIREDSMRRSCVPEDYKILFYNPFLQEEFDRGYESNY